MKRNEDIDKHIKRSLEEFQAPPKLSSFSAVIEKLERKKKRRFVFILLTGGFVLFCGIVTWLLLPVQSFDTTARNMETNSVTHSRRVSPEQTLAKSLPSEEPADKSESQTKEKSIPRNNSKNSELTGTPSSKSGKTEKNAKTVSPPDTKIATETRNNNSLPQENENVIPTVQSDPIPEEIEWLQPIGIYLPWQVTAAEATLNFKMISDSIADKKKKKTIKFLAGISLLPQANTYLLWSNKKSEVDPSFREFYVYNRKNQNKVGFNYSVGLKTMVVLNDKWEFQSGFGFQSFSYTEKVYPYQVLSLNNAYIPVGGSIQNFQKSFVYGQESSVAYDYPYLNRFYYAWYTLEASQYFRLSNLVKIKTGIALRANYLFGGKTINALSGNNVDDYYYSDPFTASPVLSTVHFKFGYIESLGKRMQIQLCPDMFVAPNSMIRKAWTIKQRPIGVGLECLLLYRFN